MARPSKAPKVERVSAGNPRDDRRILVILGMHRSGTSALAGALARVGYEMGDALLPPAEDNPRGFFEDQRVVAVNDELLAALGSAWDDFDRLPAGWADSVEALEFMPRLVSILEDLTGTGRPVAIKDPRLCRVLPLWKHAFVALRLTPRYLHIVRHPAEVAGSLYRRDGMGEFRSRMLWLDYSLSAERETRGSSRTFIHYEDLLKDPQAVLSRSLDRLGENNDAIGDTLGSDVGVDPSLRNQHRDSNHSLDELSSDVYRLLCDFVCDGKSKVAEFDAAMIRFQAEQSIAAQSRAEVMQPSEKSRRIERERLEALRETKALTDAFRRDVVAPRIVAPRVYLRSETATYSEQRCFIGTPSGQEGVFFFDLKIPVDARVEYLRIDPDEKAGYFLVSALTIGSIGVADFPRRVRAFHEQRLPAPDGMVMVAAGGFDPWIEVSVGDLLGESTGTVVSVSIVPQSLSSLLLLAYSDLTNTAHGRDVIAHSLGVLHSTVAEQAGAISRVGPIEAELIGLRHEADQVLAGMASCLELSSRTAEQIAPVQHQLEQLQSKHAAVMAQLNSNHEALMAQLQTKHEAMAAHLGSLAAESARLDAEARTEERLLARQLVEQTGKRQDMIDARIAELDGRMATVVETRLTVMDERLAKVLAWAERRTISYWWRKIFPGH